jgi:hypothetical protein
MEELLNEVRAHSFFPPKFPSIQRRPNYVFNDYGQHESVLRNIPGTG